MSEVANARKSKYIKHTSIGKTKSACSSTSISSTEGTGKIFEAIDKPLKDPMVKVKKSKSDPGRGAEKAGASEEDIFAWIDPQPAKPPSYKSANPNRRITYPVYETQDSGVLPAYSPSVEEVTVVSMKMEWLDPYNCSPSRSWKNFIMEINSTQLNFYLIDPSLTRNIKNYCNGKSHFGGESVDPDIEYEGHHSIFNSLASKGTYQFNKADQESISQRITKDKAKYLTNNRLFRTYSLQFAKFGIPTDYSRKTFVLRLRCETEQFMLSFSHVDDMIMWSMYLSIGIGVALDLDFRELPTYRTVPRRRRRRRRKRTNALTSSGGNDRSGSDRRSFSNSSTRNGVLELHYPYKKRPNSMSNPDSHSNSSSRRGSNESIKSRLKSFFGSDKKAPCPSFRGPYPRALSTVGLNAVTEDEEEEQVPSTSASASNSPQKTEIPVRPSLEQRSKSLGTLQSSSNADDYFGFNHRGEDARDIAVTTPGSPGSPGSEVSIGGATIASGELQLQSGYHNNVGLQNDLDELQQVIYEHNGEEGEETEDSPTFGNTDNDDEGEEEEDDDIDSLHPHTATAATSIYQEEGIFHDSEDDYYYVVDRGDAFRRRASSVTSNLSSIPYGSCEVKWHPPRKEMSRRRYIRDSLRCIRPLPEDEEWLGKVLICPTQAPAYETNNPPISGYILGGGKPGKSKAPKFRNFKTDKGVILNKCKNHFVKPYIVGPVGFLKTNARC